MKWSEFFSMGGYAFYVWGSYLVALIAIVGEIVLVRQRKNSLNQVEKYLSENHRDEKAS